MADTKISALTAATTPLAGTEVLPIVQSGVTKQVSVANLTSGRSVATGALTVTGPMSATTSITSGNGLVASGATYPASGTAAELGYNGTAVYLRGYDRTGSAYKSVTINEGLTIAGGSAGDVTLVANNLIQGTAAKGINFTANSAAAGMTSQLLNWYEEGTWTPVDASGASLSFTGASGYYTRKGREVTVVFTLVYPATANASAARIGGLPFTAANTNNGFNVGTFNTNNSGQNIQPSIVANATNFAALLVATGTSATNAQLTGATLRGGLTYFV